MTTRRCVHLILFLLVCQCILMHFQVQGQLDADDGWVAIDDIKKDTTSAPHAEATTQGLRCYLGFFLHKRKASKGELTLRNFAEGNAATIIGPGALMWTLLMTLGLSRFYRSH